MGTNTLLTVGALILFGILIIGANRLTASHLNMAADSDYSMTAVSIAQSIIDEAKTKQFDQVAVTQVITTTSQLTPSNTLGREGISESISIPETSSSSDFLSMSRFNDVDDYHLYRRVVNTPRAAGYNVSVAVNYVSPTFPDSVLSSQSYCKAMRVTVTHPNLLSPIVLNYPFVY